MTPKLLNVTISGRLLYTSRTLLVKACILIPLGLGLYTYAWPSVEEFQQPLKCLIAQSKNNFVTD